MTRYAASPAFSEQDQDAGNISVVQEKKLLTVATAERTSTTPIAVTKVHPSRMNRPIETPSTVESTTPSGLSFESLVDRSSDYDNRDVDLESLSTSTACSSKTSNSSTTPVPLIDFDAVVASRKPVSLLRLSSSQSPTESTCSSSSSSSSSSTSYPSPMLSSSLSPTGHTRPPVRICSIRRSAHVRFPAIPRQSPGTPKTIFFARNSSRKTHSNSVSVPFDLMTRDGMAPPPFPRLHTRPPWLGTRQEETTHLPLWSPSPLTLCGQLSSRQEREATPANLTTASPTTHSPSVMTSSLAQVLDELTSSAAAAVAAGHSLLEPDYEGPTSQPRPRSVRLRVPMITSAKEELNLGCVAFTEEATE